MLLFVIGLLLAAATIYAVKLLGPASRGSIQAERTASNFLSIQNAISAYVAINWLLPCPANPLALVANDGISDPLPPSSTCNTRNGVVPWRTLGIAPELARDGWGRLISFRVLDGPKGLTQPGGASMVNCDTINPYGPQNLPADGLCLSSYVNLDTQYLNGKGLTVTNDAGNTTQDAAYVLISHGETGYGAYLQGGNRIMPMPSSPEELANTNAMNTYHNKAHSAPGTDPTTATYFDDVVAWSSVKNLVTKAGLVARNWPDSVPPVQISSDTTTNMTTPSTVRFNSAGTMPITTDTTLPSASGVDTLVFNGAGAGPGAACIWWPISFKIYDGTTKYALRLFLEFSTTNAAADFGGFDVGFLSRSAKDAVATPFTNVCGDTSTSSSNGWGNGTATPSVGNIPAPRFAVEFDASQDVINSDPASNHLAIDFNDVVHDGTSATTCSAGSDSYHVTGGINDCYTGPGNTWLRDGLTNYQSMRVEVFPHDPACSAGAAPRIKVWVLPKDICQNGTVSAICNSAKDLTQIFNPSLPLPTGAVAIESCIPSPTTSAQFDELYFGMTASSRTGASGPLLTIRNLSAAAYLSP